VKRLLDKKKAREVKRSLDEAMCEAGVKLTSGHAKDDVDQLRESLKNMKIRESEVKKRRRKEFGFLDRSWSLFD
jgi:hypothetical protein